MIHCVTQHRRTSRRSADARLPAAHAAVKDAARRFAVPPNRRIGILDRRFAPGGLAHTVERRPAGPGAIVSCSVKSDAARSCGVSWLSIQCRRSARAHIAVRLRRRQLLRDANAPMRRVTVGRCYAAAFTMTRHPPRGAAENPTFAGVNAHRFSSLALDGMPKVSVGKLSASIENPFTR